MLTWGKGCSGLCSAWVGSVSMRGTGILQGKLIKGVNGSGGDGPLLVSGVEGSCVVLVFLGSVASGDSFFLWLSDILPLLKCTVPISKSVRSTCGR